MPDAFGFDAIGFLEAVGRGAFPPSAGDYGASVDALEIDQAQRRALRDRDPAALGALLSARSTMMCMIAVPDADEPERPSEAPGGGDDPPPEAPDSGAGTRPD